MKNLVTEINRQVDSREDTTEVEFLNWKIQEHPHLRVNRKIWKIQKCSKGHSLNNEKLQHAYIWWPAKEKENGLNEIFGDISLIFF